LIAASLELGMHNKLLGAAVVRYEPIFTSHLVFHGQQRGVGGHMCTQFQNSFGQTIATKAIGGVDAAKVGASMLKLLTGACKVMNPSLLSK
jgi:hypothetical protein